MQTLQEYIFESLSSRDIDAFYKIIEPFINANKGGDYNKDLSYNYHDFYTKCYKKLEELILKHGGKKNQKLTPESNEVVIAASNMDVIYIVWLNHENKYTRIAIHCSPAYDEASAMIDKRKLDGVKHIWEKGVSLILPESFKQLALSGFSSFAQEYYY